MRSIELNEFTEKILVDGLNERKKVLLSELSQIDCTLNSLSKKDPINNIADDLINGKPTWFIRIYTTLKEKNVPLTSRELLDTFYTLYSDLDAEKDRDYMQSLSTTLNQHITRKKDKAVIRKIVQEGKETRFELIK